MTRVVASIEARMGASRFPGKSLADIAGKPALARLVDRLRRCSTLDDIVIATSVADADDAIERWGRDYGVRVFRGSEDDVLQRVVDAHNDVRSDVVVEITGDATLTDPGVVDLAVRTFQMNSADVVTTSWNRTFPIGIDAQVFSLKSLADVAERIADAAVREHVSLYFYEHPEIYRVISLTAPLEAHAPDLRLTLDYPDDQILISKIYRRLESSLGPDFSVSDIVSLLRHDPKILGRTQSLAVKPVRARADD